MRFKFHAPWHHTIEIDDEVHHGGDEFDMDEDRVTGDERVRAVEDDGAERDNPASGITQAETKPTEEPGPQTIPGPQSAEVASAQGEQQQS